MTKNNFIAKHAHCIFCVYFRSPLFVCLCVCVYVCMLCVYAYKHVYMYMYVYMIANQSGSDIMSWAQMVLLFC